MKYKRKFGGDDAIQQAVKTNTVSSNSTTISESVKRSISDFKGFYSKVVLFVKTNFIFSLLVAILLIIYIALFFTDTVKASDLEAQVINKKCSEFKGTCPFGKRKEDTLDCDGDNCTKEKCCIDDNNCSSYSGTCPANFTITNEATVTCTGDNGACTQDNCCKKTCAAEPSITSADCTGADTEYRGSEVCTGDGGVCQKTDCCKPRVYCSTYTACPATQSLIAGNATTVCPNGVCDNTTCCTKPQTTDCSSYTCAPPLTSINNPSGKQCPSTGCDDATCCITSQTTTDCSSYTCAPPLTSINNPSGTQCPSTGCDDATCCITPQTTTDCSSYTCTSGTLKQNPNTLTCPVGGCDDTTCCN